MEVLRQVREIRPDIGIIMITAFETIEVEVEAKKPGAVNFIQKPFSPEEIRELVTRVLGRERPDERMVADYGLSIELAKRSIGTRHFVAAVEHVRKAVFLDPAAPRRLTSWDPSWRFKETVRKHKKLPSNPSLDPSYAPAIKNLARSTIWGGKRARSILLQDIKEESNKQIRN